MPAIRVVGAFDVSEDLEADLIPRLERATVHAFLLDRRHHRLRDSVVVRHTGLAHRRQDA